MWNIRTSLLPFSFFCCWQDFGDFLFWRSLSKQKIKKIVKNKPVNMFDNEGEVPVAKKPKMNKKKENG